jgi:hypothetical protein
MTAKNANYCQARKTRAIAKQEKRELLPSKKNGELSPLV